MTTPDPQRRLLRLAGALLLGGFAALALVTMLAHPSHGENDHPEIFGKYDLSDAWVGVHFGQFAAVLAALAGFVVLHRFLEVRGQDPLLRRLALAATIATAALWGVLQAVDGTALKEAVEAWAAAPDAEKAARFADAETVRWTEWGLQSYFRVLMGATLILFGALAMRSGVIVRWAGAAGIAAGTLYVAIGIAVGHSGFEKPGGPLVQTLMLIFVGGILAAGLSRAPQETQAVAAA